MQASFQPARRRARRSPVEQQQQQTWIVGPFARKDARDDGWPISAPLFEECGGVRRDAIHALDDQKIGFEGGLGMRRRETSARSDDRRIAPRPLCFALKEPHHGGKQVRLR